MAWCLSTGSTWIFGTIRLNDSGAYVMRRTEPMELKLNQADKGSNLEIVHRLLWTLICWVSQFASILYCG